MRGFQRSYEGEHRSFGIMLQSALPHHKYPPSRSGKSFTGFGIPSTIGLQLGDPEHLARLRYGGIITTFMTMPEAPMHENNGLVFGEHDIRSAWKIPCMQPVTESCGMQRTADHHFGSGVLAADPGHHPGAGLLVDDIGHGVSGFYHRRVGERGELPV